jgi:transglutaminase-like putative cysteine protease
MFYSIRHITRFHYTAPVNESVMEVRMRPRSDSDQRCLHFVLTVNPKAHVSLYRDHLGNTIHHFDVPGSHTRLGMVAEATVEVDSCEPLPDCIDATAWRDIDAIASSGEYFEFLEPSQFATPTPLLQAFAVEIGAERRGDPLSLLRELNARIFDALSYVPKSTDVDSPIDTALSTRMGVCQDFSHVMITVLRGLGIPARYVSGYLFHSADARDRSVGGATHAWLEAMLPGLGWVGFDPTNNLLSTERHIRTAIGRDYADVPPAKGVFKGTADSVLSVAVRVKITDAPADDQDILQSAEAFTVTQQTVADQPDDRQQQQQQQQ